MLFVIAAILVGQLATENLTGAIEGTVKEYGTSVGIADAEIEIVPFPGTSSGGERNSQSIRATTDTAGRFSVKGISPGRYKITAKREGYFNPTSGLESDSQAAVVNADITIGFGVPVAILQLLVRGGLVTGHVFDKEGRALSNMLVGAYYRAYRYDGAYSISQNFFSRRAMSVSNDEGTFRIFPLQPGQYYIAATSQGADSDIPAVRTFYPDVADSRRAVAIELLPGREIYADIKIPNMQGFTVSGNLINLVPTSLLGQQTPRLYIVPRNPTEVAEGPRAFQRLFFVQTRKL